MKAQVNDNILELTVMNNLVASNLDEQMLAAKEALEQHKEVEFVYLNLENVKEIDSLGINLVVGLYKQISAQNQKFSVTNTSRAIRNLFQLFKLNAYFEVS
jgi:anti-anti-sigma factor